MSLGIGIEANMNSAPHMSAADMGAMPLGNPVLAAQTVFNPNVKDSRWLTLEVCREFTRNKCTRPDTECKFAHPPPHVEVQNGRVTCCFDSIKGKCQRKDPPCKYLHPPQHLREQLVQNGRNNLILKQFQAQALLNPIIMQGAYPNMAHPNILPYGGYNSPFISTVPVPGMMSPLDASQMSQAPLSVPTANGTVAPQKLQRPDRLEQGMNPNLPGMMPMIKRTAVPDKSGMPMYQPQSAPTYSPLVSFAGQQQFVPVTQTLQYYRGEQTSPYSPGVAGHHAALGPRY